MKKILALLALAVAMVSCYEDYITDFEYTGIYFPYQRNVRTVVVGEGMKIQVGAALGGVRENTKDRTVNFVLDNNLVTPDVLTAMKAAPQAYIKNSVTAVSTLNPMPASYYSLSNAGVMVIKSGQHMGAVTVTIDSAAFLADAATINAAYALPFYITSADADSVLEPKRSAVIAVKYENMLFGNYWRGGATVVNRPGKSDTTWVYAKDIKTPDSKIWTLKTVAPNALTLNGYSNQTTGKPEMQLTLDGNNIAISSVAGSTYAISQDGQCTFNRSKLLQDRKIFLKYTYTDGTNTYHATDTLYFRNRIRDGINEWQDENPANYSK